MRTSLNRSEGAGDGAKGVGQVNKFEQLAGGIPM